MNTKVSIASSVAAISLAVSGCTVGPNYHAPRTLMPDNFVTASPTTQPTTAPDQPQRVIDIAHWWKSLGDPELDSLVERAIRENLDLEIALTRLQEARTEDYVVTGLALPTAEFSGAAAKGTGSNVTKGRVSAPLNAGTNTAGYRQITQVAGFDAGWELDIFGRYRREAEAANADTQAAAEERSAVLLTVVSDVARAYMDLRALQLRLSIARDTINAEEQVVRVVQERLKSGLTNELDVAQARTQLATVQSTVAPLIAQIQSAKRRMAVLLGSYPEELDAELQNPTLLPTPPARIEPGLPLALLHRRPDIRQAERQLAAATARIGVATASLYPRVFLTGGLGLQGQGLGRTPQLTNYIWSAGPYAYWPLLDFGALDALVDIQGLQTHELLVNYKRTILIAVEEVDDAISNYAAEQDHLQRLGEALVSGRRAAQLATERYEEGFTDFLNVLDAERQLYELQDQYARAQEQVVLQFVAVYKGLGGGWEAYQKIPPIRQPQPAIIAAFRRFGSSEDLPK